uniref:Uncharacterized protein n=1 Tax=Pararge aegeria TaxID=116150 RepID=S4PAS8_9NEOP
MYCCVSLTNSNFCPRFSVDIRFNKMDSFFLFYSVSLQKKIKQGYAERHIKISIKSHRSLISVYNYAIFCFIKYCVVNYVALTTCFDIISVI